MTSNDLVSAGDVNYVRYLITGIFGFKLNVRNFLCFEFIALIVMKLLSEFGVVPSAAYYVFDIANCFLFLISVGKLSQEKTLGRYALFPILAFAITCITSAALFAIDPRCAFWEFLVDFRLFGIMILVCLYWDYSLWDYFLRFLYRLQWINALLVVFEFFGLGLIQDNIGGMFGITAGGNGSLNLYLCFVCAYAISQYVALGRRGRVGLPLMLLTCVFSIAIAAVAEIKFFYFELVLLTLLLVVFNRPTRRTFGIVIAICLAIFVGMHIFSILMPSEFALMTNIDAIMAEADNSNISTGYGVSRINAIPQINDMFFHGDRMLNTFGMGFGSATPGMASGLFVSRFYSIYGFLRYDYLQLSTLFLQVGFVGIALYLLAVISPVLQGFHDRRSIPVERKWVLGLSLTFVVLFFINCFYMATMRTQFTFLWALMLVGPYFAQRDSHSRMGAK